MPARPPEPSVASLREFQGEPAPDEDEPLALYWRFYWAVAAAQLARWLPRRPARILDLAGDTARSGAQAAAAGHRVIQVLDPQLGTHDLAGADAPAGTPGLNGTARPDQAGPATAGPATAGPGAAGPGTAGPGTAGPGTAGPGTAGPGTAGAGGGPGGDAGYGPPPRPRENGHPGPRGNGLGLDNGRSAGPPTAPRRLIADSGALGFLTDACVDAVVAENRVLSRHLVTEAAVAEIARVLRPGGRVLLTVDSLTLGMALLAEQNCWAHLSDVPSAEVLLVPWPDGTMTRCFWAEQLRELLADAGLEVEWIRPRTVLSPSTVEHVLASSPRALPRLVRTELNAPLNDDSLGVHLLASARRRA